MWWVGGITGHDLIDSGSGDGDVFLQGMKWQRYWCMTWMGGGIGWFRWGRVRVLDIVG